MRSLKFQIFAIVIIPFAAYLLYAANSVWNDISSANDADLTHKRVKVAEIISLVVHNTQIERGMTAAFYQGGMSKDDVDKQRLLVDKVLNELNGTIATKEFGVKKTQVLKDTIARYSLVREKVDTKSFTPAEAIKHYTETIYSFLEFETYLAQNTKIHQISEKLVSLRILEEAKESGGKLRANLSAILAADSAISPEKGSLIIRLNAGMFANIVSKGLRLSAEEAASIEKTLASKEWREASDIFVHVIESSTTGRYGIDSGVYFKTISISLNNINSIIKSHIDALNTVALEAKTQSVNSAWSWAIVTILFSLGIALVCFFATQRISNSLTSIGNEINESTEGIDKIGKLILSISSGLNDACSSQATNMQETSAASDEVSAMLVRNVESVKNSVGYASNCRNQTDLGKQSIHELSTAVDSLGSVVEKLMGRVDDTSTHLNEMKAVIYSMAEKTQVINDIVFQTKLLSFNASVEAARAGENGKGFSVVAEEIGSLAALSGNAAKEIAEKIDESISKVNTIVEDNNKGAVELKDETEKSVKEGRSKTEECQSSFSKISQAVTDILKSSEEISTAQSEQSTGVSEVAVSIQNIDKITQKILGMSENASHSAEDLEKEFRRLIVSKDSLFALLNGSVDCPERIQNSEIDTEKNIDNFEIAA